MARNSDHPVEDKIKYSKSLLGKGRLFAICFLGIFVSYFIFGFLQENITKSEYGEDKERFTYTMALVFFQCVVNVIFARAALWITDSSAPLDKASSSSPPHHLYMIMSFSYVGAMLASNDALRFVSYPTQVLGKSVKPIPVMILGVLMAKKRYPLKKYLYVLMIVAGVAFFMYKPQKADASGGSFSVGRGELLLLLSLLLDGVTGGTQDKIRAQCRTHSHSMMFLMNAWSCLYLVIGLTLSGELFEFLLFCQKFPWVLFELILFSICSAIGQNFIFMTITNFGPLPCSIITTTRKFFTILGSVLIFGHPMSSAKWIGTLLVFAGLALDSVYGKEAKMPNKA